MKIIYSIFIYLYGFGISIASLFLPKAKKWVDGRKNWEIKLKESLHKDDKIIWVHCSSLGEFEQGRPVMEKIKKEYPSHKLAVSFFSPSGYEVRKNYLGADSIFYLPLDSTKNAKNLIKLLHPEILILVKYEYWYNLLSELFKNKIPVIIISAVIKEKNIFFKSWGGWFRKKIKKFSHFFVQDTDSKNLLEAIGIKRVTVSGDTRFDRVKEIYDSRPKLEFVEAFLHRKAQDTNLKNWNLIVAGSTWSDDEEILVQFLTTNFSENWKIIIAPHNIDPKKIQELISKINLPTCLYSNLDLDKIQDSRVLIVDTIGILNKIYAYSDISYVGGGFTKTGVHNTLEPAVFGVPIIFGPHYKNFIEAIDLVENKAAESFQDSSDFSKKMLFLMENEIERKRKGKAAFDYIQEKPNSTKFIMDYLKSTIKI